MRSAPQGSGRGVVTMPSGGSRRPTSRRCPCGRRCPGARRRTPRRVRPPAAGVWRGIRRRPCRSNSRRAATTAGQAPTGQPSRTATHTTGLRSRCSRCHLPSVAPSDVERAASRRIDERRQPDTARWLWPRLGETVGTQRPRRTRATADITRKPPSWTGSNRAPRRSRSSSRRTTSRLAVKPPRKVTT